MYDERVQYEEMTLILPSWIRKAFSLGRDKESPSDKVEAVEEIKEGHLYRPVGHFSWLKVKKIKGTTAWVVIQGYEAPFAFPVKVSLLQGAERKIP